MNNETLAFEQAVVYLRFKQAVIWFSFVLEQKRKISFLQKIQTGHLEYIIMYTVYKFGIKLNPVTRQEIVRQVQDYINQGKKGIQITGVNWEGISLLHKYPELVDAINSSDIVNLDGMGPVWALRLHGIKVPDRVPCPDLFDDLLKLANEKGQSVYLLGGQEAVVCKMVENLHKTYPKIKIVGYRNGYFNEADEAEIIKDISSKAPNYLYLGLPSPKKEVFIKKYRTQLNANICFGIGGAFDIWGEKVGRAPEFYRKHKLEWLFRMMKKAYFKRYVVSFFPYWKWILSKH